MATYDEYLQQLKAQHQLTAKTALKRLYELLKLEDPMMSKDDMYDSIVKDCLEIWQRQTIRNNMPDELKDSERVETGKQAREKRQPITVTTNSSVATNSVANYAQNNKPANYDEEMKQIYHDPKRNGNNHDIQPTDTVLRWMDLARDKDLEIGQLKEQLTEQKQQIQELIKSVNAMADNNKKKDSKPSAVTETLEYKTIQTEKTILEQRITELEQIVKESMKTNPSIGFQKAGDLVIEPALSPITFPTDLLAKFFIASRNAKNNVTLKLDKNGKVESWEIS